MFEKVYGAEGLGRSCLGGRGVSRDAAGEGCERERVYLTLDFGRREKRTRNSRRKMPAEYGRIDRRAKE